MHPSLCRIVCAVFSLAGVSLCVPGAAVAAEVPPAADRPVDFVAEIQPLFRQHCLECHGPEKQRSGYRLDARSIAVRGGESRETAILPGRGAESPLVRWIAAVDPEQRMPPKGDLLSQEAVGLIRAWIDQGAHWPDSASVTLAEPRDWWSLRPLTRPETPRVVNARSWVRNPVDAFILDRLQRQGWEPSPEADRRTLGRRLYFDLLGLPPSPAELEAFVADPDPQAYERLVDRLLASPQYGERWARQWLDIVHYGDTHGYDKDKPRPNAWPYRDYVIRSFNADKPYDRFVAEQIAGDVLYPDSADGIEALGFLAAGPWDFIGHEELPETKTDGLIARHLDRDDMVANTMGTFVSLTVHCAQCHDHKFDPVPQEDYYRLQAVFAALDRADRNYHPEPELNRRREELERRVRRLSQEERDLQRTVTELGGESLREVNRRLAAAEQAATSGQPAEYGYHSAIALREDDVKWVQVDLDRVVTVDRVVLAPCRDSFNNIGDGFGFPRRFKIEGSLDADFGAGSFVIADFSGEDVPNPGVSLKSYAAGRREARHVRVTATRLAPRQNDYILALAELEIHEVGGTNVALGAAVRSLDSTEAPVRWRRANLTDGLSPGGGTTAGEIDALRKEREGILSARVRDALRSSLDRVRREASGAREELKNLPQPLTAYVGTVHYGTGNFRGTGPDGGKPRRISVLSRGDVRKPMREVGPGALGCVEVEVAFPPATDADEGGRRAALARWVTSPENPLTWRSIVNRAWQRHFGRGIADTPNDFGRMGGEPSHPELLDWLAVEFRDGPRSMKALDRLLVLSATYRQVSNPGSRPAPEAGDADNRLLWRMNRRRLDAESIRDSVLAVSGKLDLTPYGPAFQDFIIEKPEHSPHYQYHLHDVEDPRSHRRSVYRFLVRSRQEPFMVALDCADPSMRVDRRNETLTPLQALALLNSRLTVAMARHLAVRVERESAGDLAAQVARAFELAVQRPPSGEELSRLRAYAGRHGLAAACRLLFNLNEFVFVD